MALLTLRMDEELSDDIYRLTKFLKKPKSEVIRECVRFFVHEMKKNKSTKKAHEVYMKLYPEIPGIMKSEVSPKEKILNYLKKKKAEGRL